MHTPIFAQNTPIGAQSPTVVFAGPERLTSAAQVYRLSKRMAQACGAAGVPWVFAAPHDALTPQGELDCETVVGLLYSTQTTFGCPVMAVTHTADHIEQAAGVADILALPAEVQANPGLLALAAASGRVLLLLPGGDVSAATATLHAAGNSQILTNAPLGGQTAHHPFVASIPLLALDGPTGAHALAGLDGVLLSIRDTELDAPARILRALHAAQG